MSVIIPCRNEADCIGLLDAVRRQDYPVHEIIVIDAGSTDETASIVRAYGEQHPEVRLQSMAAPGAGISEAMNRAIRVAGGDLVVPRFRGRGSAGGDPIAARASSLYTWDRERFVLWIRES